MASAVHCLLCQIGAATIALPLEHVIEVTRPLALQRVSAAPAWLLGAAVMRGEVTPVIDAARLIAPDSSGSPATPAASSGARWVALRVEGRRVALRVDSVLATRLLSEELRAGVPPLLASSGLLSALASLDQKLLVVLETARILPAAGLHEVGLHAGGR